MNTQLLRVPLTILLFAASALGQSSRPVEYHQSITTDPPQKVHVIIVDLSDPKVHVKVARGGTDPKLALPWETTLLPTSAMAERDYLAAAINGSLFGAKDSMSVLGHSVPYFKGNFARCCGWTVSDSSLFSPSPMNPEFPSLIVDDKGIVSIGHFKTIPDRTQQAISGNWQIVTNGQNTSLPASPGALAADKLPRSAVGIDKNATHLIMLVADGKRDDYAVGITMPELADLILKEGAYSAISLDGGGSSTLVMANDKGEVKLLNRPSDGSTLPGGFSVERAVADCLGVVVDKP